MFMFNIRKKVFIFSIFSSLLVLQIESNAGISQLCLNETCNLIALNIKQHCSLGCIHIRLIINIFQHFQSVQAPHLTINSCFSQRFILQRISLLSWHWNKVGWKSGPIASKHWGLRFSKSGNSRQISRQSVTALQCNSLSKKSRRVWLQFQLILPMVSLSYRELITEAARQGDVLGVCQTVLQRQRALGRGDEVGVGEAELHREPVLKSVKVRGRPPVSRLMLSLAL